MTPCMGPRCSGAEPVPPPVRGLGLVTAGLPLQHWPIGGVTVAGRSGTDVLAVAPAAAIAAPIPLPIAPIAPGTANPASVRPSAAILVGLLCMDFARQERSRRHQNCQSRPVPSATREHANRSHKRIVMDKCPMRQPDIILALVPDLNCKGMAIRCTDALALGR